MATQVQRRRGTTAQHAIFTGALGELTYDTDKKTAVLHDGVTPGGFPVAALHLGNIFTQTQTIQGGNLDVSGTGEFATNEILLNAAGITVGDVSLTNPTVLGLDGSFVAADGEFTISALGVVDVGGNLIHNVANPVAAQDAATKAYVDAAPLTLSYRATAVTTTFLATDYTIDCTSGTFPLDLPTAVGITGRIYVAKNSGVGTITLDPAGAELIDSLPTATLVSGAAIMVQSTGTGWIII